LGGSVPRPRPRNEKVGPALVGPACRAGPVGPISRMGPERRVDFASRSTPGAGATVACPAVRRASLPQRFVVPFAERITRLEHAASEPDARQRIAKGRRSELPGLMPHRLATLPGNAAAAIRQLPLAVDATCVTPKSYIAFRINGQTFGPRIVFQTPAKFGLIAIGARDDQECFQL
jgi:hypothetical protein